MITQQIQEPLITNVNNLTRNLQVNNVSYKFYTT